MTASALVELLRLLESAAIPVWLDGGWGVDALLETQTRKHKDVDIILTVADVPKLQELVSRFLYQKARPRSFVLATNGTRSLRSRAFDADGNGVYGWRNGKIGFSRRKDRGSGASPA